MHPAVVKLQSSQGASRRPFDALRDCTDSFQHHHFESQARRKQAQARRKQAQDQYQEEAHSEAQDSSAHKPKHTNRQRMPSPRSSRRTTQQNLRVRPPRQTEDRNHEEDLPQTRSPPNLQADPE